MSTWTGVLILAMVVAVIAGAAVFVVRKDPLERRDVDALTAQSEADRLLPRGAVWLHRGPAAGDVMVLAGKGHEGVPTILRLHPDGDKVTLVWQKPLVDPMGASGNHIYATADTIYVPEQGRVEAFDLDGHRRWATQAGNEPTSCLECDAIVGDRFVYVSPTGQVKVFGSAAPDPLWTREPASERASVSVVGRHLLISDLAQRPTPQAGSDPDEVPVTPKLLDVDPASGQVIRTIDLPCGTRGLASAPLNETGPAKVLAIPGTTDVLALWDSGSGCAARIDLATGRARWSKASDYFRNIQHETLGTDLAMIELVRMTVTVRLSDGEIGPVPDPEGQSQSQHTIGEVDGVLIQQVFDGSRDGEISVAGAEPGSGRPLWSRIPEPGEASQEPPATTTTIAPGGFAFTGPLRTVVVSGGNAAVVTIDRIGETVAVRQVDPASGRWRGRLLSVDVPSPPLPPAADPQKNAGSSEVLPADGDRQLLIVGRYVVNLPLAAGGATWVWPAPPR